MAPDEMIGEVIDGRYRVESHIGSGGFAEVYRALDLRLELPVAIKLTRPEFSSRTDHAGRFHREARVMRVLRHPVTVRTLDYGPYGDSLFIAMELAEGRTLKDVLQARPALPPAEIGRLLGPVLDALHEAHTHGVIHRDIKPGNIIVGPEGADPPVRLLDFGIARLMDDADLEDDAQRTREGMVIGTPSYMAPEVIQSEAVQPAADLYAMGCVLYEAAAGARPFGGIAVRVLTAHINQPPPPLPPGVPAALSDVILRAMEKRPEARYPSAAAMALALRTATRPPIVYPDDYHRLEVAEAPVSAGMPRSAAPLAWLTAWLGAVVRSLGALFRRRVVDPPPFDDFTAPPPEPEPPWDEPTVETPVDPPELSPDSQRLMAYLDTAGVAYAIDDGLFRLQSHPFGSHLDDRIVALAFDAPGVRDVDRTLATQAFELHAQPLLRLRGDPAAPILALAVFHRRPATGVYKTWFDLATRQGVQVVPVSAAALDRETAAGTAARHLRSLVEGVQKDPFLLREPVRDPLDFFGVDALVGALFDRVVAQGSPVVLYGLPKSGVSSVLHRLRDEVSDRPRALIDLKALDVITPLSLLDAIADAVVLDAERFGPRGAGWQAAADGRFAEVGAAIKAMRRARGELPPPLILIDECEELARDHRCAPTVRVDVLRLLYRLGCDGPVAQRFPLVLGGDAFELIARDVIPADAGDLDNPLWGRFELFDCPLLEREAFDDFVTLTGARVGLTFTAAALDALFAETGGHVYLSRLLGSAALAAVGPGGPIDAADVERLVPGVLSGHRPYLEGLVRRLPPTTQDALRALARGEPAGPKLPAFAARHHLVRGAGAEARLRIGLLGPVLRDAPDAAPRPRPRPRARPRRVFVSYSHHDPAREAVRALVAELTGRGFEVRFDEAEPHPKGGWAQWAVQQIEASDLVVLVCGPKYHETWQSDGPDPMPGVEQTIIQGGLGARWEATLLRQILFEQRDQPRLLPVLFGDSTAEHVPLELRGVGSYFHLPSQRDAFEKALGPSTA